MEKENSPKNKLSSEEPVLGSHIFGELTSLRKKYSLELKTISTSGKNPRTLCWLSRDEVPEGFSLPLPPKPIRFFNLSPNEPGEPLKLQTFLGAWAWEHASHGKLEKVYRDVLQRYVSREATPHEQLRAVRDARKAIEDEKDRQEQHLRSVLEMARAAVSALLHVASNSIQEKQSSLPKNGVLSRYSHTRALLHGDLRLMSVRSDQGWLSKPERVKQEAQRRWVLEGLVEDYSLPVVLQHEGEYLWKAIYNPKGELDLQIQLKMFSDFFEVNDDLVQTTGNSLLHFRRLAVKTLETLALLDGKRGSLQVIESHLALDRIPPGWKGLKADPEEDEELLQRITKLRALAASVETYWDYAWELYTDVSQKRTWRDVYRQMTEEEEELGLDPRYGTFESFKSARLRNKRRG